MIKPISRIIREKQGANYATVGILGDISFHNIKPAIDVFTPLIPLIRTTDLIVANVETVISDEKIYPEKNKGIFLKSPSSLAKVLKEIGVNIALVANNHIDDYGEFGILDTISYLEKENILVFGTNKNKHLNINVNGLSFEMQGFVTPYDSDAYLLPYGKTLNDVSVITRNNEQAHLLYFLHGFDELFSIPFPWRVKLLESICQKCFPSALICGHQHVYQGFYLYNNIPVCLSYGNGFMNIEYHHQNPDAFIGCYSILHFDQIGCFQIDEYYYQITNNRILELSDIQCQYDRVMYGINTIKTDKSAWEQECFLRLNEHKYNRYLLINLLYDIYRFVRYYRKWPKYIHYRSILNSYMNRKWKIDIFKYKFS